MTKTYGLDETLTASDGVDVFNFGDVKDDKCALVRITAAGKPVKVAIAGPKVIRRAIAVNATQVLWVQDFEPQQHRCHPASSGEAARSRGAAE